MTVTTLRVVKASEVFAGSERVFQLYRAKLLGEGMTVRPHVWCRLGNAADIRDDLEEEVSQEVADRLEEAIRMGARIDIDR